MYKIICPGPERDYSLLQLGIWMLLIFQINIWAVWFVCLFGSCIFNWVGAEHFTVCDFWFVDVHYQLYWFLKFKTTVKGFPTFHRPMLIEMAWLGSITWVGS